MNEPTGKFSTIWGTISFFRSSVI